jgi:hypothetical protein
VTARKFEEKDYPMFKAWWKAHGWEEVPPQMLSPDGIVIEQDGKTLCGGWVISTNTQTALFEWIVKDPEVNGKRGAEALDTLIVTMKALAKQKGYTLYVTFTEHGGLTKRFTEHHGAHPGDKTLSTVIGPL